MHKYSLISLLLIMLMTFGGIALGQGSYHITGKQLLNYCQDTTKMMQGKDYNVSKSSWCIGFIQGSVTSHRFFSTFYTLKKPEHRNLSDEELRKKIAAHQVYCVPTSVTLGQLVRDVVQYLQTNPKYQQEPASVGVARALYKVYPCKLGG